MKNTFILLILLSLLISGGVGCKTGNDALTPPELKPLVFEKSEPYKLDLDSLPVPDEPIALYGKLSTNGSSTVNIISDVNSADALIYTTQEASKFAALGKLTLAYKDIAKSEEKLVNVYVDKLNTLKEFTEIERQKSMEYRNMWNDANFMYKNEVKQRQKDSILHKLTIGGMSIVFIGILAAVL